MALIMHNYRHKKFDLKRSHCEDPEPECESSLQIKRELLSRTATPASVLDMEDSSSHSSMQSLAKRLRLDSDNTSPAQSLPNSISVETLRDICKYHGNMVRKFPKKERTPKDQERRNKNTIACRISRRTKKLQNLAVEEEYKELTSQHLKIVEQSMRSNAYLEHLKQLVKHNEQAKSPAHKNFSIDYLINGI